MLRFIGRWLKRIVILGLLLLTLSVPPALWIEFGCMQSAPAAAPARPIVGAAWKRNLADTWLTYPEWSIVHAYEDYADVVRDGGEARFDYLGHVTGFWARLCNLSRTASSRAPVSADVKAMLYIIGASFTAEMTVKGVYESTIGRFTAWLRGPELTPEDAFTLNVNEDYAVFLQQTPWYEYPFGETLLRFWRETPWGGNNMTRKIERRFAMTLEYGGKALYAKAIGALAGLSPATLRIRSVVRGLTDEDVALEPRITVVERRPDGSTIIETPRYRIFTEILLNLADRGRDFVEIGGNDEIFVTSLAPFRAPRTAPPARQTFAAPIQARPGWQRRGVTLKVTDLAQWMRDARDAEIRVEHVYDY